jgi:predicted lipoprotein with Yx(FWY)xxD motif
MRSNHFSRSISQRNTESRVAAALLIVGGFAVTLGATSASGAPHSHGKGVVISTAKSAKYGTILVSGTTLYTLKPSATRCAKACLTFWNAVLLPRGVTKATAGTGVSTAKLGTVKVSAGVQVTYGGKALYWFFLDTAAGQVKGNVTDTWGKWSDVVLVKPAAKTPTTTSTEPPRTTTTTSPSTTTTTTPTTTTTSPSGGGGIGF